MELYIPHSRSVLKHKNFYLYDTYTDNVMMYALNQMENLVHLIVYGQQVIEILHVFYACK
jgi:hypothetical protein